MKRVIKVISIVSYLLIILKGQMIALPFGGWLVFTSLSFGNIDQLFAILAIIGLILNFSKWKNSIFVMAVSFILMLIPIVSRLVQVPIEMFGYLAFQIPLATFIIGFFTFILVSIAEKMRTTQAISHADTVDDNITS